MLNDDTTIRPLEATEEDLLTVHTHDYLKNLRVSLIIVRLTVAVML